MSSIETRTATAVSSLLSVMRYTECMQDDRFDKLFSYMEKRFDAIETKLDAKADKADVDHLINTMDDFIRRITDSDTEQAARDAQWNRPLEWAREVSKKTGVPLPDL